MFNSKVVMLFLLVCSLILLFFVDVSTGELDISFARLLQIISGNYKNNIENIIVNDIRIPTALMAIVVGFSLSLSGCILQTILNNPLASPYSLGISSASGFGAALSIVYGSLFFTFLSYSLTIAVSAFLFALLSSVFIFAIGVFTKSNTLILILIGIAISFAFQSALSAIQYFATPEESQYITFWLFGSFIKSDYQKIYIIFSVFIFCFCYILKNSWILTALRLGDEGALAIGIPLKKVRLKFFFATSLLTATSVAFVGIIGFVGIVAPHTARFIVGEDHRFLIPYSVLIGGIFLLLASIISKVIVPGVIFPVGIVTAVFGVPFFIGLILVKRNKMIWS